MNVTFKTCLFFLAGGIFSFAPGTHAEVLTQAKQLTEFLGRLETIKGDEPLIREKEGILSFSVVTRLRNRGFLKHLKADPESIQTAIKSFQKAHMLPETGTLTCDTLEWLNAPLSFVKEKIKRCLERWKKQPITEKRFVLVNIPSYRLYAFEAGQCVLESAVMVGTPKHPTPELKGKFSLVCTRPTWYPPMRLVKKLSKKVGKDGFSYEGTRLVQRPGPRNLLGAIKFPLYRLDGILFHGTRSPQLFTEKIRAFSLGCVRVEELVSFAVYLLKGHQEGDLHRLSHLLAPQSKPRGLKLRQNVPVYIVYMPCWVTPEGDLRIFNDVYRKDKDIPGSPICQYRQEVYGQDMDEDD